MSTMRPFARALLLMRALYGGEEISIPLIRQRCGVSLATAKRDLKALRRALPLARRVTAFAPCCDAPVAVVYSLSRPH